MPKSSALSLKPIKLPQQTKNKESERSNPLSPTTPASPPPSGGARDNELAERSFYVGATPVSDYPRAPQSPTSPRHKKESSKSFFSNSKASKSSSKIKPTETSIRQVSESEPHSTNTPVYSYRHSPGSSPELGKSLENASIASGISSTHDSADQHSQTSSSVKSGSYPHISSESSKRGHPKNRFPAILSRTRSTSVRGFEEPVNPKPKPSKLGANSSRNNGQDLHRIQTQHLIDDLPAKSAPLEKDRGFREMMTSVNSSIRNRSVDRHAAVDSEDDASIPPRERKEGNMFSSSFKEGGAGAHLLSGIKHGGSKAADGLGKAGRGFFGKLTRSGSSNDRDPRIADEDYVCKVINLPLVEQTRKTRISKRLEDSKDKTEFWMPALPWRCIDYLNMKGVEEEGLYRVPGSGKEIRHWQARFDREHDINLFDEPDLYDINIIGSMFKAWLRELPDELFPKAVQARIAEQCAGAKTTPQMLKDELSKLPPFNYYLLFAITCHISLLHSCSEMNKMDYRNLCICFQPCMKIEAFCFQFLVLDWRNCWQGCWTEKEYLVEEMRVITARSAPANARQYAPGSGYSTPSQSNVNLPMRPPPSSSQSNGATNGDRTISSSGSSVPSVADSSTPERQRVPVPTSRKSDYDDEGATPTQAGQGRINSELPELSPMKPLSPF